MSYATYSRLDLHVMASNRAVIKAASKKLNRMFLFDRDVREKRHEFYRAMLAYHADARALYYRVTTGSIH